MFPIVVQSAWGVLGACLGRACLGVLGHACFYVLYVWAPTFLVTFEAIFCSNNICFLLVFFDILKLLEFEK